MRKTQLILTVLIDEIPERLRANLLDALQDECPIEVVINGRHLTTIKQTAYVFNDEEIMP